MKLFHATTPVTSSVFTELAAAAFYAIGMFDAQTIDKLDHWALDQGLTLIDPRSMHVTLIRGDVYLTSSLGEEYDGRHNNRDRILKPGKIPFSAKPKLKSFGLGKFVGFELESDRAETYRAKLKEKLLNEVSDTVRPRMQTALGLEPLHISCAKAPYTKTDGTLITVKSDVKMTPIEFDLVIDRVLLVDNRTF